MQEREHLRPRRIVIIQWRTLHQKHQNIRRCFLIHESTVSIAKRTKLDMFPRLSGRQTYLCVKNSTLNLWIKSVRSVLRLFHDVGYVLLKLRRIKLESFSTNVIYLITGYLHSLIMVTMFQTDGCSFNWDHFIPIILFANTEFYSVASREIGSIRWSTIKLCFPTFCFAAQLRSNLGLLNSYFSMCFTFPDVGDYDFLIIYVLPTISRCSLGRLFAAFLCLSSVQYVHWLSNSFSNHYVL